MKRSRRSLTLSSAWERRKKTFGQLSSTRPYSIELEDEARVTNKVVQTKSSPLPYLLPPESGKSQDSDSDPDGPLPLPVSRN